MNTIAKTTNGPLSGLAPTGDVFAEEGLASKGIGGQKGAVPDANSGGLTLGVAMALSSYFPASVGADFETRLAEVTDKLKATTTEAEKGRVQNEMETKRLNIEENQTRMKEAQEKQEKAEVSGEVGKIFNAIGIAFQLLGAIGMAVMGAALIATGVGGPAGALMLVGAALMVVSAVNSIVAASTEDGLGIGGSIAKASGADMKTAGEVDMGVGISLAIISAAVAIAATVVSGGAAAPAVLGALTPIVQIYSAGANIGSALSSIGSTTANAVGAGYSKEATDLNAKGKMSEGFMQQLDDLIDQAMTMLMAANDRFNKVIDSLTEMNQDTSNTLSNTRFAG